jgi:hypothetical protein
MVLNRRFDLIKISKNLNIFASKNVQNLFSDDGKSKNSDNILSEYDTIKYKNLLDQITSAQNYDLDYFINHHYDKRQKILTIIDTKIKLMSPKKYFWKTAKKIQKEFKKLKVEHFYEIGFGNAMYANAIFRMRGFRNIEYFGYEISRNAIRIAELLTKDKKNFKFDHIENFEILAEKRNTSVVFSVFSIMFDDNKEIIDKIIANRPKYMVLIEPVFESVEVETLYDLLKKQYASKCKYTLDTLEYLRKLESKQLLRIVSIKKDVFGNNIFLPATCIICKIE